MDAVLERASFCVHSPHVNNPVALAALKFDAVPDDWLQVLVFVLLLLSVLGDVGDEIARFG